MPMLARTKRESHHRKAQDEHAIDAAVVRFDLADDSAEGFDAWLDWWGAQDGEQAFVSLSYQRARWGL